MKATINSWLVYRTAIYASIQDKKLAVLYYTLFLLVAVYSIFNIIIYKGYFEYEEIVGTVTFTLEEPKIEETFCKTTKCEQRDITEVAEYTNTGSFFIAWQIEEFEEELKCENKSFGKSCKWVTKNQPNIFDIPGFDNYTIVLSHYAKAPLFAEENENSLHYSGYSKQLSGVLLSDSKKKIKVFNNSEEDRILIRDLFTAVNKSPNGKGTSFQIDLKYNNARCDWKLHCAFGVNDLTYRYAIRALDKGKSITNVFEYAKDNRKRIVKHGIEIEILQSGKLGKFSLQALFSNFVTNFGLFAIFVALLDIVALYLLPHSALYRNKIYKLVSKHQDENKNNNVSIANNNKDDKKNAQPNENKKSK